MPKETYESEARVALTPAGVASLRKAGFAGVVVESSAGAAANFSVRSPLSSPLCVSPTLMPSIYGRAHAIQGLGPGGAPSRTRGAAFRYRSTSGGALGMPAREALSSCGAITYSCHPPRPVPHLVGCCAQNVAGLRKHVARSEGGGQPRGGHPG